MGKIESDHISVLIKDLKDIFRDESFVKEMIMNYFNDYFPVDLNMYIKDRKKGMHKIYLLWFIGCFKDRYNCLNDDQWEYVHNQFMDGNYWPIRKTIKDSSKKQGEDLFIELLSQSRDEFHFLSV